MWNDVPLEEDIGLSSFPPPYESTQNLIDNRPGESYSPRKNTVKHVSGYPRQKKASWKENGRFKGWKFTMFVAFISSLVILLFNAIFVLYIVSAARDHKILYEGNCEKVHNLSTLFHLIINVLSTVLLSASNYGMQCLVAPTRRCIDRAHKQNKWLDIGVPSVRNLFRVSTKRSILWVVLALSSLPFHLMYNAAIFPTTGAPAYNVFAGPGNLENLDMTNITLNNAPDDRDKNTAFGRLVEQAKNSTLHQIDNSTCLASFAQTYQTKYGALYIVTNNVTSNTSSSIVTANPVYQMTGNSSHLAGRGAYPWMCPNGFESNCTSQSGLLRMREWPHIGNWTVNIPSAYGRGIATNYSVDSCLAEPVTQHCRLQYSTELTAIIIALNILKSVVLLYIWLGISNAPLLTIGDAVASFLTRPDVYSQGMCMHFYSHKSVLFASITIDKERESHRNPLPYSEKRKRWGRAASIRRWTFSMAFWIAGMLTVLIFLLNAAIGGLGGDIWNLKIGSVEAQTIISMSTWPQDFLSNVIIANIPQLVFSFLYFAFNSLLTAMCLAAEWSRFATEPKGLRVSNNPKGAQRSNYFLTIPYRYALPLLVVSGVLPWLISLSLFMVAVEAYDTNMVRDPASDVFAVGYSPVAQLAVFVVVLFLGITLISLSCRRFKSGMPIAGSYSLAIAAACHPKFDPNRKEDVARVEDCLESEGEDDEMALLPIQWGAVPLEGPVGHCTFTSGQVQPPERGEKYQ